MTSPIGLARNRRRATRGFTLVELLIVCAILGVLLGATVPAFRGSFRHASLKRAASDVASLLRYARECARCGECGYRVVFDGEAGSYWLQGFATPLELAEADDDPDGAIQRWLPKDVAFMETDFMGLDDRQPVTFYPDGASDAAVIALGVAGEAGETATVRVSAFDGAVSLSGI